MTTIDAIRSGIATNLATITGLRTTATVPESLSPPTAVVVPVSVTFDRAFRRGLDEYEISVLLFACRADARTAQNTLDDYCDPTGSQSVKTAIESDRTLAGSIQDLRVTSMRNYGPADIGGTTYLAAEFVVQVYA